MCARLANAGDLVLPVLEMLQSSVMLLAGFKPYLDGLSAQSRAKVTMAWSVVGTGFRVANSWD